MPHPIDNLLAKAKYIRRYKKPNGKWGYVYPKDKTSGKKTTNRQQRLLDTLQSMKPGDTRTPRIGVTIDKTESGFKTSMDGFEVDHGNRTAEQVAQYIERSEKSRAKKRGVPKPKRPSQDWHGGQEHIEAIKRHANVDGETAANMVVHANVHRMQHSGGGVPSKRDVQKLKQHYDKHGDKSGAKGGKAPEPDEALQNKPKSKKQKKSKPVEVHENPMGDPVVQQGSNHVVFSATDNGVRVTMRGSKAARFAEKHPELFDYARGNPRQGVVGFMQVSQDKAIKLAKEHLSKADTMSVDRLLSKSAKRSTATGGDTGLLAKAKYIRRYKKPNGKWGYVYPKDKKTAESRPPKTNYPSKLPDNYQLKPDKDMPGKFSLSVKEDGREVGISVVSDRKEAARVAHAHEVLNSYSEEEKGNLRRQVPERGIWSHFENLAQRGQDLPVPRTKRGGSLVSKADTMSVDRLLSKSSKRSFVSGSDQGSGGGSSSGRSSSGSAATAGASAGSSTGGGSGGTGSSRQPVFEPGSGSSKKTSSLWGKMVLHDFTSEYRQKNAAKIPDKYLLDYLCSFVEEAYEHESREPKHKNVPESDRASHFARLVMNELVQAITTNKNLMRAAQRYKVNANVIERILVSKGIIKPQSDSDWTDRDSAQAMGAEGLSADMAYSAESAWLQPDPYAAEGRPLHKGPVDNVATQVVDDSRDPSVSLQSFQAAQARALWPGSEPAVSATIAPDCPVHNGADMTKAQNLWNPMAPCTCKGEPNAYG